MGEIIGRGKVDVNKKIGAEENRCNVNEEACDGDRFFHFKI